MVKLNLLVAGYYIYIRRNFIIVCYVWSIIFEPRHEKICLRGLRPGHKPACAANEVR